jgi:hypothetical protein
MKGCPSAEERCPRDPASMRGRVSVCPGSGNWKLESGSRKLGRGGGCSGGVGRGGGARPGMLCPDCLPWPSLGRPGKSVPMGHVIRSPCGNRNASLQRDARPKARQARFQSPPGKAQAVTRAGSARTGSAARNPVRHSVISVACPAEAGPERSRHCRHVLPCDRRAVAQREPPAQRGIRGIRGCGETPIQ